MRCINLLERPTSGNVVIDGTDLTTLSDADLRVVRRRIGMIFQHFNLLSSRTVFDNAAFPLELIGMDKAKIKAKVDPLLDLVGLTEHRNKYPAQLSGGQKQKVAIASVLALNPRVLVLDEPTAELDPASSQAVFDLLARYAREHGTTVVVVEQKIALLSQYADMLVIVNEGRVRFADEPAKVLEHSDELKRIGVNCPRSTKLMNRLRAEGLYGGASVRNVREAREALREVLA